MVKKYKYGKLKYLDFRCLYRLNKYNFVSFKNLQNF